MAKKIICIDIVSFCIYLAHFCSKSLYFDRKFNSTIEEPNNSIIFLKIPVFKHDSNDNK